MYLLCSIRFCAPRQRFVKNTADHWWQTAVDMSASEHFFFISVLHNKLFKRRIKIIYGSREQMEEISKYTAGGRVDGWHWLTGSLYGHINEQHIGGHSKVVFWLIRYQDWGPVSIMQRFLPGEKLCQGARMKRLCKKQNVACWFWWVFDELLIWSLLLQ